MRVETKIIKNQLIEYTFDDAGKIVKSKTIGPVDENGNVIKKSRTFKVVTSNRVKRAKRNEAE